MTARHIPEGRAPWTLSLLGALLRPWLKIKRDPAEPAQLLDPEQPGLYVIERRGISDTLILDQACLEAGLPSPLRDGRRLAARRRRALLALEPQHGLFGRAAATPRATACWRNCAHCRRSPGATCNWCRCRSMSVARPTAKAAGSACCSAKTGPWSAASAACWRCC
ncbi:hypothetical protein B1A_19748 [mine drainage metagenome]|uniref:Uncharacterized protein n=1 Tax=mine drainage metagenome TaxID=410659 RepID=T0YIM9_9ZZZZ